MIQNAESQDVEQGPHRYCGNRAVPLRYLNGTAVALGPLHKDLTPMIHSEVSHQNFRARVPRYQLVLRYQCGNKTI